MSNDIWRTGAPWMHPDEVACIEKYIGPATKMLEWGSGGSTLHFGVRVASLVSIEHVGKWHRRMAPRIAELPNVTYIHVPADRDVSAAESDVSAYRTYLNAAVAMKPHGGFDAILIDGRASVAAAAA